MKRLAAIVGLVTLLTLPAAALANVNAPASAPASDVSFAQAAGVTIVDFAFTPSYVSIPAGSTVSWYNAGAAPHTATSTTGAFATGVLSSGVGSGATLWTPGVYSYYCEIHPSMVGTVQVY
jgi:plastocyanin